MSYSESRLRAGLQVELHTKDEQFEQLQTRFRSEVQHKDADLAHMKEQVSVFQAQVEAMNAKEAELRELRALLAQQQQTMSRSALEVRMQCPGGWVCDQLRTGKLKCVAAG